MADSAANRASRDANSKRAASGASSVSTVSPETEDKLARAAQSAQRLAQLSETPREDDTLELFPDDPTRALVQAMEIDVRQATLSGFELPGVVLAAVGGAPSTQSASARRTARAKSVTAGEVASENSTDGMLAFALEADDAAAGTSAQVATIDDVATSIGSDAVAAVALAVATPDATSPSSALTQETAKASEPAPSIDAPLSPGRAAAQARDAARAQGGDANRPGSAVRSASAPEPVRTTASRVETSAHEPETASVPTPATPATPRATRPAGAELERARATAFADTVDALYGVIADQRRTAAELTRRLKWVLAVVIGALLVTVGICVAQTMLLARLARDSAAQQQRIEQLVQNQQAALQSLIERIPASPSAPAAAAAAPAQRATTPSTATPALTRHARPAHPHRPPAATQVAR